MITLNEKQYSGNVLSCTTELLTLAIHSVETLRDIVSAVNSAKEVVETINSQEKTYTVTCMRSAKQVSENVYILEFHTRAGFKDDVYAKLKEANDAIDALLVALLEG